MLSLTQTPTCVQTGGVFVTDFLMTLLCAHMCIHMLNNVWECVILLGQCAHFSHL